MRARSAVRGARLRRYIEDIERTFGAPSRDRVTLVSDNVGNGQEGRRLSQDSAMKQLLHEALKSERGALAWKAEGLSEADARRPMTPSATSILGVIKHLAAVERGYFCDAFGRARDPLPWEDDELWYGGDMWARPDESSEFILATYRESWSMADAVIDELDLDAPGTHWSGTPITLGWMLVNVLVDTSRHAGHADIVREQIDGAAGLEPSRTNTPDPADGEYWTMYRKRIDGELSKDDWISFARSRSV